MSRTIMIVALAIAPLFAACSSERIRYEDPKRAAMVDKDFNPTDRRTIVDNSLQSLLRHAIIVKAEKNPTILAGLKFIQNRTDEHIKLDAILDLMVNSMTESGKMDVVDLDKRPDLHDEYGYHATGYIDPTTVKGPGRQKGADYILSIRLTSETHKGDNTKVISYQVAVQLVDLSTSVVKWSNVTEIQKTAEKSRFGF